MKKLRRIAVFLILVCVSVGAFACQKDDPRDKTATRITMYMYQPEDWAVSYLNGVKDSFNEAYAGEIKIDIRYFFGAQYNANLSSAIENGTCPDIFTLSYSNLAANVKNGYLEPLKAYFTAEQWADVIPQSMEQLQYGEEVYAYPWYLEPSTLLYYRKDIVEDQLGFAPQDLATFDGIYNVCRAMVNNNKVPKAGFPMYIPVGIPRGWATIGMQYNSMSGKYAISDDWTTSNLGEQGLKDLAEFYFTIGTNGWCPQQDMTERGYEDASAGIGEGYWLMNLGGSWDISLIMRDYPEMKNKIRVIPAPTSTTERNGNVYATATNGGWNMCISSASTTVKKQAAAEFIRYMFLNDAARAAKYFEDSYMSRFPTTRTVQAYLDGRPSDTPAEWLAAVKTVAELALPEPRYSWDVINLVNDMLSESMGASKTSAFNTAYGKILSSATAKMTVILARGETNPYLAG
jgi:ABC-type glycerol-3-phosphate transport system substrate-binding protein